MVTVKLFGTIRTDARMKEMQLDVSSVKDIYAPLYDEILRHNPEPGFTLKDLKNCFIVVNGVRSNKRTALQDGDEVYLLTAVAGG